MFVLGTLRHKLTVKRPGQNSQTQGSAPADRARHRLVRGIDCSLLLLHIFNDGPLSIERRHYDGHRANSGDVNPLYRHTPGVTLKVLLRKSTLKIDLQKFCIKPGERRDSRYIATYVCRRKRGRNNGRTIIRPSHRQYDIIWPNSCTGELLVKILAREMQTLPLECAPEEILHFNIRNSAARLDLRHQNPIANDSNWIRKLLKAKDLPAFWNYRSDRHVGGTRGLIFLLSVDLLPNLLAPPAKIRNRFRKGARKSTFCCCSIERADLQCRHLLGVRQNPVSRTEARQVILDGLHNALLLFNWGHNHRSLQQLLSWNTRLIHMILQYSPKIPNSPQPMELHGQERGRYCLRRSQSSHVIREGQRIFSLDQSGFTDKRGAIGVVEEDVTIHHSATSIVRDVPNVREIEPASPGHVHGTQVDDAMTVSVVATTCES